MRWLSVCFLLCAFAALLVIVATTHVLDLGSKSPEADEHIDASMGQVDKVPAAVKEVSALRRTKAAAASVMAACSTHRIGGSSAQRRDCVTAALLSPLADEPAIEIGGPSKAYDGKPFNVYRHLNRCDNVRFSERTLWERQTGRSGSYPWVSGKRPGRLFILDAANLQAIPNASYSVVMSAHNLEHLANPLKALQEQRRILRPGGVLLLTLPNKKMTFDHRRPTATLAHLLDDLRRDTAESDLSHLDEILRLHDLDRDRQAGGLARFRKRSEDNARNRGLHQHVFDEALVAEMLAHLGFAVVMTEVEDIHIFTVAIRDSET